MVGIEKEARVKANGTYITVRRYDEASEIAGETMYSGSDGRYYRRDELEFSLDE